MTGEIKALKPSIEKQSELHYAQLSVLDNTPDLFHFGPLLSAVGMIKASNLPSVRSLEQVTVFHEVLRLMAVQSPW